MAVRGVVEDSAPTKHAVRVDWFHRDPGGGTIFVMPAGDDGAASQPIAERGDHTATNHG